MGLNVADIASEIIAREGGFVNDPTDPRRLGRNNGYALNALESWAGNAVGNGVMFAWARIRSKERTGPLSWFASKPLPRNGPYSGTVHKTKRGNGPTPAMT